MITPPSLRSGDTIAILSPATTVKEEYIDGAVKYLRQKGFNPVVMPSAKGPAKGSYAASLQARLKDMRDAILNPDVRAIFCSRGGYGCIHLLPELNVEEIYLHPKWIIGFSDVSALHALWLKAGVESIHGPMAKHLATSGEEDPYSDALIRMLQNGGRFDVAVKTSEFSINGKGYGVLRGGNLAVLNSLASTPYDILTANEEEDVILFLEDISEAIYAVERMLSRLCMAGVFHRVKGLIFGQFTEYKADRNFTLMEEMIADFLKRYNIIDIPVAIDFPVGHTEKNYPLTEGKRVELTVNNEYTRLKTL